MWYKAHKHIQEENEDKEFVGLGDMARLVKSWSHEYECLSSIPKHSCEKLGVAHSMLLTPVTKVGRYRQVDSWGSLAS